MRLCCGASTSNYGAGTESSSARYSQGREPIPVHTKGVMETVTDGQVSRFLSSVRVLGMQIKLFCLCCNLD